MKKLSFAILMASAAINAGCGGGSSSSSDNPIVTPDPKPQSLTLKGVVYDPNIEQAVVKFCQIQDATNCASTTTLSNSLGGYELTLNMDSSTDLTQYAIFTEGGTDIKTQRSFENISLSAPYSLQSNNVLNPNPISSMMTKAMKEGKSAADAKVDVMAQLGVDAKDLTDVQA